LLAECYGNLRWLPSLDVLCSDGITQPIIEHARRELRRLVPEGASGLALSQLPLACAASRSFQEHCGYGPTRP